MTSDRLGKRNLRRGVTLRGALLLTSILGGSVASGLMAVAPAMAQEAPAAVQVNVSAGQLDAGLRAFSDQSGTQLIYSSDLVAGKVTPGVAGRVSLEQGVAQLLRGTGLTFRVVNGRTVQIELPLAGEDGERVLGAVRVEGSQAVSVAAATRGEGIAQLGGVRGRQDAEVEGYRPRIAAVSSGTPLAIEDIPRSLTVLTPEQIEKQDIVTLDDALRLIPGVTVRQTANSGLNTGDLNIYVRGYALQQYQVDGGVPRNVNSFGNSTLNLDAYERLELIRGPNSAFVGADSPGGSINLVSKRPGAVPAQSVTITTGSFGRRDAIGDVSTPSLFGTPIAFRGVASIRNSGTDVNDYEKTSSLLYGIFDAPLGDDARLEFSAQYNKLDADGENNGVLRYNDGGLIDLGRQYNTSSGLGTYSRVDSLEFATKLYVNLREDWDFEFGGFYNQTNSEYKTLINTVAGLRSTGGYLFNGSGELYTLIGAPAETTSLGLSSKLTGRFETFGLEHNVFASVSYGRTDPGASETYRGVLATVRNLDNLRNPVFLPTVRASEADYSGNYFANTGVVIGDTISWKDILSFTATVRNDSADNAGVTAVRSRGNLTGIVFQDPYISGTWRPSFSLTYKPIEKLTAYASYSDGFTRQDNKFSRSGTTPNFTYAALDPSPFTNTEVGLKYGTDGWLASISLYDLKNENLGVAVAGSFGQCPNSAGGVLNSQCFSELGETSNSRGVDVEFNGQIFEGLGVIASYNYNDTETTATGLTLLSIAPQSTASLFVDWEPSFMPRLALQAGLRYKGEYFSTGTIIPIGSTASLPFEVQQDAYTIVDVGATYQFNDNMGLHLYVENVTDETYLSTIKVGNNNFYGNPRTFTFSLKWNDMGTLLGDGRSPTTGLAPFGDPADWYGAFDTGYNMAGDLDSTAAGKARDGVSPIKWNYETEDDVGFAARLGYRFAPAVRGEVEVKYRTAEFGRIGGNAVAPFGVCGSKGAINGVPFNCDDVTGKSDNWSMMTNALYDFGNADAMIRPFLGGGVGLSRNSVNFQGKMDGIGGTTPYVTVTQFGTFGDSVRETQESIGGVSTRTSFTWQAIAGASFKLSDRMHIDATYRYVAVPDMEWSSYNVDVPKTTNDVRPLTPRAGDFKADYNSHMLSIGLRWAFGGE